MPPNPTHGPRLSDDEYDRKIVELHRLLPPMPTKELERYVRIRELDLAIDHRLGCDFPESRREALRAVQDRVEKKRLRLAVKYLLRRIFPGSLARGAQGLAGFMVDEYAKVLTNQELRSFFDFEDKAQVGLPIDVDQLKK